MRLLYLLISVAVYVVLCYVPGLNYVAKPVELLCTFLHEFGHAFFSLVTGGSVHSLCVNMDGSGVTCTSGGSEPLILMGGYVGSAAFGNAMIRLATGETTSSITLKVLSTAMIISSMWWFDNLITTGALLIFGVGLFLISNTKACSFVLSFLGVACVVYIVQDFNVGPSSDLKAYEGAVGVFSANTWMYVWLVIVVAISGINLFSLKK